MYLKKYFKNKLILVLVLFGYESAYAMEESVTSEIDMGYFADLPIEVIQNISERLSFKDFKKFRLSNKVLKEFNEDVFAKRKLESTKLGLELIAAILAGKLVKAKDIIKSGDANINTQDSEGYSSLMYASARGGYKDIVILLLNEPKINLNLIDKKFGFSALMMACVMNRKDVVELLINAKADINLKCKKGFSALYWATFNLDKDIVSLLFKAGADIALDTEFKF